MVLAPDASVPNPFCCLCCRCLVFVQVDKQAEDRCHRLGQHRPVHVHRLVLTNTVDNNIYDIAQRKLRLDAAVLGAVTVAVQPDGGGRGRGSRGGRGGGRGRGGRGGEGSEHSAHMGEILAQLLAH